jgi:hypothetical protein
MTFSFVLAGWEGSAHDGKVLADALHKGLVTFPGRYYLGDAGYGLTRDCLTPYRGIRYHLKEWVRGARRPQNREELFNLRHSMLRNVVERTFGVAKSRFGVLSHMHSFDYIVQTEFVMCCCMLHNFIRLNQGFDDEFDRWEDHRLRHGPNRDPPPPEPRTNSDAAEERRLNAWRDGIAQEMWDAYQIELTRRRII